MNEENEKREERLAALEALLFIHGEPLPFGKIEKLLGIPTEEVGPLVGGYSQELAAAKRGLALIVDKEKVQLVTKPKFHSIIQSFVKEQMSEDLTPASVETLAIIAYFGPISRARIEYQRGVNSIFILRNLLLRGLIERFPDPEHPQSFLYQPSFDLLKHLGISKKEDLPEYDKFKSLLTQFENTPQ